VPRLPGLALLLAAGLAAADPLPDLSYPPPGEAALRLAPGQSDPGRPITAAEAAGRAARHLIIGPDFRVIRPRDTGAQRPGRGAVPAAAKGPARAKGGRPLLWRISRRGLRPSHLFGTLHVDDPRVLDLPPAVTRTLRGSRRFVMEAVLDDGAPGLASTEMLFRDGRSLKDAAGPELAARALPLLEALGIPRRTARLLQPWAAALLLSRPPARGREFLDRRLARLARQARIPVRGLETLEEQMAVFRGMSRADQVALLADAVARRAGLADEVEALVRDYLAGDLDALARRALADAGQGGAQRRLLERLLHRRNAVMLGRLKPHLRAGGAFVAVGALHLAGRDGLIEGLRRQGYRVSRVR